MHILKDLENTEEYKLKKKTNKQTEIVSNSTIQRQSVLPFESSFLAFGNSYTLFGRHYLDHTLCIADHPALKKKKEYGLERLLMLLSIF